MLLGEKLEILINRKHLSKTEFAEKVGITYRGLANYLNGSRKPKRDVLERISEELGTSVDFLTNDNRSLILDSKERFVFNSTSDTNSVREAAEYLEKGKAIFECPDISLADKQALFSCLTEVYFNAAKQASGEWKE